MQVLTQIVSTSGAEVALLRGMDEDLKLLEDCVGACERIYRTPIPLSCVRPTAVSPPFVSAELSIALWHVMQAQS